MYLNEWMMHIYSALLCIVVHPKCFTIMGGGGGGGGLSSTTTSVQHPLWCDGSHRTTAPVRSPHTSYRWRGERDRASQVHGDYTEVMIDKGQWGEFGQDTGVTPLLFTRSAMGFLITTESQDFGLTSHPKDSAFDSVVSPSLYWGVRTHTDHRGAPLAGLTNTSSICRYSSLSAGHLQPETTPCCWPGARPTLKPHCPYYNPQPRLRR